MRPKLGGFPPLICEIPFFSPAAGILGGIVRGREILIFKIRGEVQPLYTPYTEDLRSSFAVEYSQGKIYKINVFSLAYLQFDSVAFRNGSIRNYGKFGYSRCIVRSPNSIWD